MEREKVLRRGAVALFLVSSLGIVLRGPMLLLGPVSVLFLLIPPAAERLFRMKLGTPLWIGVVLFCMLGFNLGTALRWYHRFPGFDKVVHFLSGILFAQIGLCLYGRIGGKYDRKRKVLLQITYGICFAMCIAAVWEICEYMGFLLTGHDSQNVATTGVNDTMQDIIACLLGSLVLTLGYLRYARSGKSLLMQPVLAFDRANIPREKEDGEGEELHGST